MVESENVANKILLVSLSAREAEGFIGPVNTGHFQLLLFINISAITHWR